MDATEPGPAWHVLWTHSHCERLLFDQLSSMGYKVFLPELSVWSRRAGARRTLRQPMFPGYLFLNGINVRGLAIVLRAPNSPAVLNIH